MIALVRLVAEVEIPLIFKGRGLLLPAVSL